MTSKIEVPRKLLDDEGLEAIQEWAEQQEQSINVGQVQGDFDEHIESTAGYAVRLIKELRAVLAAPEAPCQELVAWLDRESGAIVTDKLKPLLCESGFDIPLYAAPLSPDHSGGAGEVVLPVVWRIPVNGEWFYGTKEQCEREYAEYTADFTDEDFDEDGPAKPEPLAALDKVKELNQ